MQQRFEAATAAHTQAMVERHREYRAPRDAELAEWRKAHPSSGRPLPPECPSMGEISARETASFSSSSTGMLVVVS